MASDDEDPEGEYFADMDADPETTCSICHAEFLDSDDLDMHMQQVHKDSTDSQTPGSKVCQFCDANYRDLDEYALHIAEDHLTRLICCQGCRKCFIDELAAKKHARKHQHKSSLFACSQCPGILSTRIELLVHELVNHDNKIDGEFLLCMPNLSCLLKLNVLNLLQTVERVLECHSCKFTTVDIQSYLNHLKKGKCVAYVCNTCCYVSNDRKGLIKHLHHRKKKCIDLRELASEMTTCTTCKKRIYCREMEKHLGICNIYKCYICDINFMTIEGLSAHQSEVHPIELDVIRCKFCHKEFVGQVALDKHMKRSHSHQFILYKYACQSCDQIFMHPQALFAHYFMKHKDLEPYTCRICNKKFKIRKRFTIHIKMEHKGAGVVEFDENYHVFFAEKKSEKPFIPKCVIPELIPVDETNVKTNVKSKSRNDDMTTEVDETEIDEDKEPQKIKPKRGRKRKRNNTVALSSSEEEEAESLLTIKKRAERKHFQKRFLPEKRFKKLSTQRKQFTCKVCNKYCYTFQNYHNHIKIHTKNEPIECVKCSKKFKSKTELTKHVANDHATSKLIETLKNVLERKQGETQASNNDNTDHIEENFEDLTPSQRFMRTIKKVKLDKQSVSAIIAPSSGDISVKNFIENFVPDVGETASKNPKQKMEDPVVTVKQYESPFYRKHSIKMTRFKPEPPPEEVKLKMPVKFKSQNDSEVKISVKLVEHPIKPSMFETYEPSANYDSTDHHDQDYDPYEDNDDKYDDKNDAIPEVAQEVMLEESDEPTKPNLQAPRRIVIPKLPAGYPKIHIATLQPQAPYFKIITVKNTENTNEAIVIDPKNHKQVKKNHPEPIKLKNEVINLPNGTKFVTANPLAHLLGDKPVEEILEPIKNKRYKPVITNLNIKSKIAYALQNLDKSNTEKKAKKKENTEVGKSLPTL